MGGRFGRLAASETMPACYMAVTLVLLCTYPLSYVPVLPGDSVGQPVVQLAQLRPQILLASYAALGPTLAVIDIVYAWLRPRSRLLAAAAAAVIGQIVDSLIFFPLAFWDASVDVILIAAASGVVLKIPMTLAIAASGLFAMSLSKRLCSKPASTTTG